MALQLHFDSLAAPGDPVGEGTINSAFDSQLAVSIIKDFLLGVKSGAEVQRIAHLSFEDQAHESLDMASLKGTNREMIVELMIFVFLSILGLSH